MTMLPFFPSKTTSTVLPKFSKSASATLGMLSFTAPASRKVADEVFRSIGDWKVPEEQAEFAEERLDHRVLETC
jgi:hypothetical protein